MGESGMSNSGSKVRDSVAEWVDAGREPGSEMGVKVGESESIGAEARRERLGTEAEVPVRVRIGGGIVVIEVVVLSGQLL